MSSDSKCTHCNAGRMMKVDVKEFRENIGDRCPPDLDLDKLMGVHVCDACGFFSFLVAACDSCSEWECGGTGIANSNLEH